MQKRFWIGLFILMTSFISRPGFCGPPFLTDDPEPVEYRHWEFYISSISTFQDGASSGTSPHFEVNYGVVRNVQIHLLLPMNFSYMSPGPVQFGYTTTEVGIKYRFLSETKSRPQIGTFPITQIPTHNNIKIGNNYWQVFIPVWLQKSWNKFTTYGGVGYTFNTGPDQKNSLFAGLEAQYDVSNHFTPGGEYYFKTADTPQGRSSSGFNLGGSLNFTSKFHFIFSLGHTVSGDRYYSGYAGLLWTI